jgi:hypothetical protein
MSDAEAKRARAGAPIVDLCRACKALRDHTIIAVDTEGRVLRVTCDFCKSQHDYRGGGSTTARGGHQGPAATPRPAPGAAPFPLSGERERSGPAMSTTDGQDLERMLRRVLREELGVTAVVPADKWRGGELVLRPGKPGVQEKKWPIESFFHKVVGIRNRLRTLEQQVNAADLPEDAKVKIQTYITGCYGSLTSFNVLFADEDDHFRGSGGAD